MKEFLKEEKRFNLFSFLIFFAWLFIGSIFFIIPLYIIGPAITGLSMTEYLSNIQLVTEHTYVIASIAHVIGIVAFIILFKKTIKEDAINFKNKWLKCIIVIIVGFILLYLSNLLMNYIYQLLGFDENDTSSNQESIIAALHGSTVPFVIIYTVILAPIFEEIVFRKLFYNTLKLNTKLPTWAIVLIIATVFSLIHVMSDIESLAFFPQYFVLALIITSAYAITKENLFVSTGLHFLNNLYAVLEIIL